MKKRCYLDDVHTFTRHENKTKEHKKWMNLQKQRTRKHVKIPTINNMKAEVLIEK